MFPSKRSAEKIWKDVAAPDDCSNSTPRTAALRKPPLKKEEDYTPNPPLEKSVSPYRVATSGHALHAGFEPWVKHGGALRAQSGEWLYLPIPFTPRSFLQQRFLTRRSLRSAAALRCSSTTGLDSPRKLLPAQLPQR